MAVRRTNALYQPVTESRRNRGRRDAKVDTKRRPGFIIALREVMALNHVLIRPVMHACNPQPINHIPSRSFAA